MFAINAAPYVGLEATRDKEPAGINGEKGVFSDVVVGHGVGGIGDDSEGVSMWVPADGRNMAVVGNNMN